jgi:hypothetical protein
LVRKHEEQIETADNLEFGDDSREKDGRCRSSDCRVVSDLRIFGLHFFSLVQAAKFILFVQKLFGLYKLLHCCVGGVEEVEFDDDVEAVVRFEFELGQVFGEFGLVD